MTSWTNSPTDVPGVLRIGTCGSQLAAARADELSAEIVRITSGAVELVMVNAGAHPQPGGVGAECLTAVREALCAEEYTFAVHAMSDVPAAPYPHVVVGAIPERADARDVLCAHDGLTLEELAAGARVGATSARRIAQLTAARPDLTIIELQSDVDAQLAQVGDGSLDAVVVSAADLGRLGLLETIACQFFDLSEWPTDPGQGALAVEVRDEDAHHVSLIRALLARLDHRSSRTTVTAERAVRARLEAHTSAPFGAYAVLDAGLLLLSATVYLPDGQVTSSHAAVLDGLSPAAAKVSVDALGRSVADELVHHGVAERAPAGSES